MAQTRDLLTLVDEFPSAFANPDAQTVVPMGTSAVRHTPTDPTGRTQQLLQLVNEFASAFADPDTSPPPVATAPAVVTECEDIPPAVLEAVASQPVVPAGHTQALHRRLTTIGWGQIDVYLSYGESRLQSIWIAVGKSGTEVHSLCEAIARLINLLLAQQVPIPEITRQIRGIRGADSEGFGPHRILGLADLMGKVLQEAPDNLGAPLPSTQVEPTDVFVDEIGEGAIVSPELAAAPLAAPSSATDSTSITSSEAFTWASMPEDSQTASLCPECGAELQVMNGCSGGACNVCGYSSCS